MGREDCAGQDETVSFAKAFRHSTPLVASGSILALLAGALTATPTPARAVSGPVTINAEGGTTSTNGLRVSLDRGWIRVLSDRTEVLPVLEPPADQHVEDLGPQPPARPTNGIYLRVGSTVVGGPLEYFDAVSAPLKTRSDWTKVTESGGSTRGQGTIISRLSWRQPRTGKVYAVDIRLDYPGRGAEVGERFTVHVPRGNREVVKLYQLMMTPPGHGYGYLNPLRIGIFPWGSVRDDTVGIRGTADTRVTGLYVGPYGLMVAKRLGTYARFDGPFLASGRDLPASLIGSPFDHYENSAGDYR